MQLGCIILTIVYFVSVEYGIQLIYKRIVNNSQVELDNAVNVGNEIEKLKKSIEEQDELIIHQRKIVRSQEKHIARQAYHLKSHNKLRNECRYYKAELDNYKHLYIKYIARKRINSM